MRRSISRWTLSTAGAALTILLAGCGSGAGDPAKGGVTPREAQALNDAAAMLDDNGSDAPPDSGVATNDTDPISGNAQ